MTDELNDDLRAQLFSYNENNRVFHTKTEIEKHLPGWVKADSDLVVAGGCFASSLQGENLKDIDIFILGDKKYPAIENQRYDAIKRKMKSHYRDIKDNTRDYVRDNDAVAEVWTEPKKKIQFIFTHHETRQELINDFDYVHCMTSYQLGKLYITRKIFDAIMKKELIVNNSKNIQEWRRNKFLGRSYKEIEETKEVTLGDIFERAINKIKTTQTTSTIYEWDDSDDEFSWVK